MLHLPPIRTPKRYLVGEECATPATPSPSFLVPSVPVDDTAAVTGAGEGLRGAAAAAAQVVRGRRPGGRGGHQHGHAQHDDQAGHGGAEDHEARFIVIAISLFY